MSDYLTDVGCEFKPHWGQFLTKFILLCVTLDLSDNLTEMRQSEKLKCEVKLCDHNNAATLFIEHVWYIKQLF